MKNKEDILKKIHVLLEQNWHLSLFHGPKLLEHNEINTFVVTANKIINTLLTTNVISINDLGKEIVTRRLKKLKDRVQWEIAWLRRKDPFHPVINQELMKFAEDAYIREWRSFLNECLRICGEDLALSDKDQYEYHFSQGEHGKASLVILGILKQATVSIDIIDTYLDAIILELLEDISNGGSLNIRLIGKNVRSSFGRYANLS